MKKIILLIFLLISANVYADSELTIGGRTGAAHIIQDEGVSLRPRPYLNISGDTVTAYDDSGKTIIRINSAVDGSGTANYVAKWSDSDSLTNSIITDNGTNVGVGTASPATKMDVNGALTVGGTGTTTFGGTLTVGGTDERIIGATNGEYIDFDTDGNVCINGADGTNNEDICFDFESTADTVTLSSNTSANIVSSNLQIKIIPSSTQNIAAGDTVNADACGGIKLIASGGAVTTSTANTFTAPSILNAGCCMDVVNSGAQNITLDNNANFVSAGAADVVLGAGDSCRVCSSGASGKWYQVGATGDN